MESGYWSVRTPLVHVWMLVMIGILIWRPPEGETAITAVGGVTIAFLVAAGAMTAVGEHRSRTG